MSPARPSDRRLVTVCQWASKNTQVTAICITAMGRTMISSERPNSELGNRRRIARGHNQRAPRLALIGRQHIADAPHRLQIAGVLRVSLDLAAQARDCLLYTSDAADDLL